MQVRLIALLLVIVGLVLIAGASPPVPALAVGGFLDQPRDSVPGWDQQVRDNARDMIDQGRQTFRHDTFGSEGFFGNTI